MSTAIVGTAGTYYVMAQLAAQGLHASATLGNAPFIDVLVASADGSKSASIQVKTSRFAQKWRKNDTGTPHHYEWDLGHKVKNIPASDFFFFVFVDLRIEYWNCAAADRLRRPDIFVIPLEVVRKWYLEYASESLRSRLWVLPEFLVPYKEAYHLIHDAIGKPQIVADQNFNSGLSLIAKKEP